MSIYLVIWQFVFLFLTFVAILNKNNLTNPQNMWKIVSSESISIEIETILDWFKKIDFGDHFGIFKNPVRHTGRFFPTDLAYFQ